MGAGAGGFYMDLLAPAHRGLAIASPVLRLTHSPIPA